MPFFKIGDINLFYEAYGPNDQAPLIFLHGWSASSEFWIPQVDYFKDKRKLVLFDLRGHGQSDKPHVTYSISQFSDDLFFALEKLGIGKIILVGHSMGGMTALRFTLDHPEFVEKLILIDTSPKGVYSVTSKLFFMITPLAFFIAFESFLKWYVSHIFHKDFPKALLEEFQIAILKNPKHVLKASLSAIKNFDVSSDLSKILSPTLIIHGREQDIPLRLVESMTGQIPNAKLVIIEGATHVTPIETPNQVWEAIEDFFISNI